MPSASIASFAEFAVDTVPIAIVAPLFPFDLRLSVHVTVVASAVMPFAPTASQSAPNNTVPVTLCVAPPEIALFTVHAVGASALQMLLARLPPCPMLIQSVFTSAVAGVMVNVTLVGVAAAAYVDGTIDVAVSSVNVYAGPWNVCA